MWHNIPTELKERKQWCCADKDKIPLTPKTGKHASPTDVNTWGTYDEAVRSGKPYIGYMLAPFDPFFIIDLDNKPDNPAPPDELALQKQILERFDTYQEKSVSGTGFHIVGIGKIPGGKGVRAGHIEIYSQSRFMIFTGVIHRKTQVKDCQDILLSLVGSIEKPTHTAELVEVESDITDKDLLEMALNAANGDKFHLFCNGEWQKVPDSNGKPYDSQSEADMGFMGMIAFYTKSNEQAKNFFKMTGMYRGVAEPRRKGDKYLNDMLVKIRANEPAKVDIDLNKPSVSTSDVFTIYTAQHPPVNGYTFPPGLIGEIAQYFYETSIRPVKEIALAGAIGLTAGIAGRAYNASSTGLNQYIILVAGTGTGKEGAHQAIDRLLDAVRPKVPTIRDTFVGPSAFASGQALVRRLDRQRCFVSILGEFGLTLQQLCDPQANSAQIMLKKVLLDLYMKSGFESVLAPSVYSDNERDTGAVQAPALTILGESTPSTFFEGMDQSHIAEGLIPRFSVIQYNGPRVERNKQAGSPPSAHLIQNVTELATRALATEANNRCAKVQADSNATFILDAFDQEADYEINSASGNDAIIQLWNRAHLKAIKMAALLAVGVNFDQPLITADLANWSVDFVKRDVASLSQKFRAGEIGKGSQKQQSEVKRIFREYLEAKDYKKVEKYDVDRKFFDAVPRIMPMAYMMRRTTSLNAFKTDTKGASNALKNTLADLCEMNLLKQIPPLQVQQMFGSDAKLFVIGSARWEES